VLGNAALWWKSAGYPAVTLVESRHVLLRILEVVDWFGTEGSEAWRAEALAEAGSNPLAPANS
jgi:hypothetical protein